MVGIWQAPSLARYVRVLKERERLMKKALWALAILRVTWVGGILVLVLGGSKHEN
jgi:hypothetical protein